MRGDLSFSVVASYSCCASSANWVSCLPAKYATASTAEPPMEAPDENELLHTLRTQLGGHLGHVSA